MLVTIQYIHMFFQFLLFKANEECEACFLISSNEDSSYAVVRTAYHDLMRPSLNSLKGVIQEIV